MWSLSKFIRVPAYFPKHVRTAICHDPKDEKRLEPPYKMVVHKPKFFRVVMVRHGESEWNDKNLFTGWYDAQLTPKGIAEAEQAGLTLRKKKYCFDIAFTSVLTRAIETLDTILAMTNQKGIPVRRTWRLNERHYGALTGLNKQETAAKYGEDKVRVWRRSYATPPPKMEKDHPYYREIVMDYRYKKEPVRAEFPMAESLKLTLERTLPYWENTILPRIAKGKRVLIAAHGNSLRGIVKELEGLSDSEIVGVNLPTGIPFQYLLDTRSLKPLQNGVRRFLGDPDVVRKAAEAVANQGNAKE